MAQHTQSFGRAATGDTRLEGNGTITATTTSQEIVPANPGRVALVVTNINATNPVYLGLGVDAVVNQGIRLSGATSAPNNQIRIDFFTGAVNVVAGGSRIVGFVEI